MTNTSTDTFRELCAKLADAYEHELDKRGLDCDLLCRARAALAQPEPEGPTDEELDRLLYYEFTTSTGHGERVDARGFARAVLARFGRPVIEPVPVSESLPGEGDCDAEGRCWWEYPESKRIVYDMNPIDKEEITTPPAYYLQKKHPLCSPNQRWLPHHALPVPTTRSEENFNG